jgi:tRNA wybutosine-synthesizing protein 3
MSVFMDFERRKKQYMQKLGRPDKSRAGSPDPQIMPLLDVINASANLYTTSSCAGRIMVMEHGPKRKKNETKWLFVSHDMVKTEEITKALHNAQKKKGNQIWFKMEPPILHVCARDAESAQQLLASVQSLGYKHAGISPGDRIIVEIIDNPKVETPIALDGNLLVDEDYLDALVGIANGKLKQTRTRLNQLTATLQKTFSRK